MPQEHVHEANSQDFENIELSDVIDVPTLQEMMNAYYALTGIGVGIIDLKGKVLVGTGWQDICTKFHRVQPESRKFCYESDINLSSGVAPGTFKAYRCKNNMWDMVTPIMLGDKHIGNIFLGQFLYDDEEPDYDLFRSQARLFGYDETAYIAALDRVPRWSRETVQKAMDFYSKLAQTISKSNYSKIQLARSEERFKALLNATSVGIAIHDKGLILDCNKGLSDMTGFALDELVGMDGLRLIAPDWLEVVMQNIQRGYDQSYEVEGLRKDGTQYPLMLKGKNIHFKGRSVRVIEFLDITEQKRVEESLWLMNHVFFSSAAANSIAGLDGIITEVNNAFLRVWGYRSRDEAVGRHIAYFFNDPNEAAAIITALNDTGLWEGEFSAKRGDGSTFIAHGIATEVRNTKGKVTGYYSACQDVTDRKQAEAELFQAKAAAESANIAKSQFLATMSHEIRTPMNGVIGMIQLLQHTELTQEQQEYAESAKSAGIELVHLLNDILDLSRIEANKIELEKSDFDLQSVISDTIKLLSLSAREKGVKLTSSIDTDVPTVMKGDAGRLRQIISNLIGNAIKFTPKGTITLNVQKDTEDIDSVTLRFLVHDSGVGVAADKLEHIFAPFTQADSSTTRRYGGTGLGLAICRRLAVLMGGSVGVVSTEGVGSTFWFTVKMEKLSGNSIAAPKQILTSDPNDKRQAVGTGFRILLTDDEPSARKIVPKLLKSYGYQIDVAGDGKEALLALEKHAYDLVLMDCMMPEMNGYEVTAIIRNLDSPVLRHDIPVIALTGNAMKQDRNICIAAGMDDYLAKPILLPDLLAMLGKWLKKEVNQNQ